MSNNNNNNNNNKLKRIFHLLTIPALSISSTATPPEALSSALTFTSADTALEAIVLEAAAAHGGER